MSARPGPLAAGLCVVLLAVAACRRGEEGNARRGGAAGAPPTSAWSCASAAGLCTCVEGEVPPGRLPAACAESRCCFVDARGRCSCRVASAPLGCDELRDELGAVREAPRCPPE